jgi:hypothetical protein
VPVLKSSDGGVAKVSPPVEPVCAIVKPVSAWPASSAGPGLAPEKKLATVCGPASSPLVTVVAPSMKPGASSTASTRMVNWRASDSFWFGGVPLPLSRTRATTTAVPFVFGPAW